MSELKCREPRTPFEAGKDCARKGADKINCHFRWFTTRESMREWERGRDSVLAAASSAKRRAMSELSKRMREHAESIEPLGYQTTAVSLREAADLIDRLPVTADGVPVVPGMRYYFAYEDDEGNVAEPYEVGEGIASTIQNEKFDEDFSRCYSTREAAEAAASSAKGAKG